MVAYAFDATKYDPQYGSRGGSLPPGRYKGVLKNSRREPNAKGTGDMLVMDATVIEGPLKDQFQTDRLNLLHTNAETVRIANQQLSAYCAVIGVYAFQDTVEIENKPFLFEVKYQKGKSPEELPNGPNYTEIVDIRDLQGNPPSKAGSGPRAAAPVAAPPPVQAAPAAEVRPTADTGGWGSPSAKTEAPAPAATGWDQKPAADGGGWAGR